MIVVGRRFTCRQLNRGLPHTVGFGVGARNTGTYCTFTRDLYSDRELTNEIVGKNEVRIRPCTRGNRNATLGLYGGRSGCALSLSTAEDTAKESVVLVAGLLSRAIVSRWFHYQPSAATGAGMV